MRCTNFIIKGVWHHIAVTMEGSSGSFTVYKDGILYSCAIDV